jgi:hypothetical protein
MNSNVQIGGHSGAALGVVVETGTDAVTGKFYAIQALTETQFSVLTENGKTGDAMTGFAIPAGTIIYNGLGITAFTLASGRVRAYKMQ